MMNIRGYRSAPQSFGDLLPWERLVAPGVVQNHDGSYTAGWYYRGEDINSATARERNVIAARANAVLARLGSGWAVHIDVLRAPTTAYPAPGRSHFPDPVTQAIEDEIRARAEQDGNHYTSTYTLLATYTPPARGKRVVASAMVSDPRKQARRDNEVLEQFQHDLAVLEGGLKGLVRLHRMDSYTQCDEEGREHAYDELLSYLAGIIADDWHPLVVPVAPMFLSYALGSRDFATGHEPRIGETEIAVVAIDGFPQESYPGILTVLDQLPVAYRWNTRFVFLDEHEAVAELKRVRRKWQQRQRGFFAQLFMATGGGLVNEDAVQMAQEAGEAIAEASSQLVKFGYYTSVVVLMGGDREQVNRSAKRLKETIDSIGFSARVEGGNTVNAWLGSMPGNIRRNLRRVMVHTMNLSDMLPLSAVWAGHEEAPCPFFPAGSPALIHCVTEGSTPFRLNLHVGDIGHTLVLGPTGSGKSTLLATIAAQFRRYPDSQVFAFDKGNSLLPLTAACGGDHYDLGGDDTTLQFCPLLHVHTDAERAWAEDWIGTLLALQGLELTPPARREITRAMRLLTAQPTGRSLTDFTSTVQSAELRDALKFYTHEGSLGHLLDAEHDALQTSRFMVFDIDHLMDMGERFLLPVLLYLFHRVERRLQGAPSLLALDEAWVMLSHAAFRDKIREWLKTLRRANCAALLSTQSISDATHSGILDVIHESCQTKIFLPNATAGDSHTRPLYESLGLNERQIELISHAEPKRQYYYASPEGRRMFELGLGPVALSFVGVSGRDDLAAVRKCIREHGEQWPARWLAGRGINPDVLRTRP